MTLFAQKDARSNNKAPLLGGAQDHLSKTLLCTTGKCFKGRFMILSSLRHEMALKIEKDLKDDSRRLFDAGFLWKGKITKGRVQRPLKRTLQYLD